jgi:hypothetical protein
MAQQTAVEWLIDRLVDGSIKFEETEMGFLIAMKNGDEIEQAKEMEKEQLIKAHGTKVLRTIKQGIDIYETISGEKYYNETYNK